MIRELLLLLVVYGGLSIAALLLLVIAAAIAKTRLEVGAMAAICGTLVAIHVGELVYLFNLGQVWVGDGIDPMVLAGTVLAAVAGVATALFVRKGWRRAD